MVSSCIIFCLVVASQGATVTPMQQVITLLKDLSATVEKEGAKEAAQYDKFACFCKEQADDKLNSIEKSRAKIADLKAEILELDTAIAQLNSEISKLSAKISELEEEIKAKTKNRNKGHAAYDVRAKDMNEAIDACGAAIAALKDSKSNLKGAKTDLVQVTRSLVKAVSKQPALAQVYAKAAPKFEYQSNDIIATLQGLLATFKSMKKDLDIQEFDTNAAFERNRLGLSNEQQFAEKEKAEKESIVEAKTEQLEAAKSDRDDENSDMNSDQSFLDEVTSQCEGKAAQFDQRSSTRAAELTALADATAELEKGAVPNFSANKKLVGLQLTKLGKKSSSPVTFVQINEINHQKTGKDAVLQRARTFLNGVVDRTRSRVLSALAVRVNLAEDHFVKVRKLIKDLIAKLRADATSEATQKTICDKGMKKAVDDRDEAQAKIEVANAMITTLTAKQNTLEDEIDTLNGQIADLKRELFEATELRADEKAGNDKTVSMSEGGTAAVEMALGLLRDFYKKAFVQTSKYTPPKSDRDGNTVGDLAPEVFDSSYHGAQAESKGIVGILEVILSDFQRTNAQVKKDEKASQQVFKKLEADTNEAVDRKQQRIEGKRSGLMVQVAEAESDILDQQQALTDAKALLDVGLEALEDLEAMCVKGEETWEERSTKRKEEVEALKEALTILDEWQA